jgi:hypothetical protein
MMDDIPKIQNDEPSSEDWSKKIVSININKTCVLISSD